MRRFPLKDGVIDSQSCFSHRVSLLFIICMALVESQSYDPKRWLGWVHIFSRGVCSVIPVNSGDLRDMYWDVHRPKHLQTLPSLSGLIYFQLCLVCPASESENFIALCKNGSEAYMARIQYYLCWFVGFELCIFLLSSREFSSISKKRPCA